MTESAPAPYDALFARFASLDEIAACVGVRLATARQFRNRGRLPPAYWERFRERAPRYGVQIRPGELEDAEILHRARAARARVEPEMPLKGARP